jgi:two-component system, response regulator
MDRKVIFLVEDNPDDEALMLRALKKNNIANDIVVAHDGAEAVDYLFATGEFSSRDTEDQPQLILLDLKLPKLDGLEVLRRIRSDGRTKYIPVVVLTTSKEQRDIVESYQLGANSFVQKPIDFNEFMEATRQLGTYWLLLNQTIEQNI